MASGIVVSMMAMLETDDNGNIKDSANNRATMLGYVLGSTLMLVIAFIIIGACWWRRRRIEKGKISWWRRKRNERHVAQWELQMQNIGVAKTKTNKRWYGTRPASKSGKLVVRGSH